MPVSDRTEFPQVPPRRFWVPTGMTSTGGMRTSLPTAPSSPLSTLHLVLVSQSGHFFGV